MNKTMNNLDITDISNLSIEDTTWIVHLVDYVDENDLTLKSIEVIDTRSNSLIGCSTLPYEKPLDEEIKDIIKETALKPLSGPSRLPTRIQCSACDLTDLWANNAAKIRYSRKVCSMCSSEDCKSIFYCWSKTCNDKKDIQHQELCSIIKEAKSIESNLMVNYQLKRYEDDILYNDKQVIQEIQELVQMKRIIKKPINNWKDYFQERDLQFDKMEYTILLTYPLTIYSIIKQHFKKDNLHIGVVGAEIESKFSFIFQELCNLLPNYNLFLYLIGPNIVKKENEDFKDNKLLIESNKRDFFHEIYQVDKDNYDFIICFNSGFVAYGSWIETIDKFSVAKLI